MERVPQSIAKVVVFRAYLSSDHVTPATGKTIAVTISKNGGAFGNPNVGALNATEISSGFYKFTLDTTDTGTLGPLTWRGAEAAIDDAGNVMTVASANNAGFAALPDTAVTTNASLLTSGTGTDQLSVTTGRVDVGKLLGTAWLAPGTAGTPDVNVKLWNALPTVELPLVPTTAGRKLDVSVGGEAGLDWANIGSPTTVVGLTNTTVGVVSLVTTLTTYTGNTLQTGDAYAVTNARLPAALVGGRMDSSVGAMAADTITASALAADALAEIQAGTYEDAAVWIDTVNGAAGTTSYVNGTKHNPCSTLAAAVTIAAAVKLRRFHVVNGSTITLAGAYTGWSFRSDGTGIIALGGQALTNVEINGFLVSGICTTGLVKFIGCSILGVTIPPNTTIERSTLAGTITFGSAGDYYLIECVAANIGGSPNTIDFGAGLGNSTFQARNWAGTLSLANMGQTGTDSATVAGMGRLEIAASSQNSTVRIAGHMVLANSGTNMTLVEGGNYRSANSGVSSPPAVLDMGQRVLDRIDYQRGHHTVAGSVFYVDGIGGNDANPGTRALPFKTISAALAVTTNNAHDEIVLLPSASGGPTTITETAPIDTTGKNYVQIRGPGRDVVVTRSNDGDIFTIASNGVGLSGFRIATFGGAASACVRGAAGIDFMLLQKVWLENAHQDAVACTAASNAWIDECTIIAPVRDGVRLDTGAGTGLNSRISNCEIRTCGGSAVNLIGADASFTNITRNHIHDSATGVTVGAGVDGTMVTDNRFDDNAADITDGGTNTQQEWNFFATSVTGGVTLADGVAHGGTPGSSTATFAMSRWNVTSQTLNTTAVTWTGNGTGKSFSFNGGATGPLGEMVANSAGSGLAIYQTGAGGLLDIEGFGAGNLITAASVGGDIIYLLTGGAGKADIHSASTIGIKVDGTTTLTGAVSLGSTLGVTGATTLAALNTGTITTTGNLSISGTTTLTGAVTASSDSNSINLGASGLAKFFTLDTTKVFANAVSGSVVEETALGSASSGLTAAGIASAIWQDAVAGDFTVANSVGKSLYNAFTANTSVFTVAALANAPTGGSAPTAAQNATAVWQDLLAGADFGTVGSIGALLKLDIDAAISSRMATYTQPTGFLAATFPGGTIANTTNITTAIVTLADAVAHGGTPGSSTATFAMSQMNVTSQSVNEAAVTFLGNGSGPGLKSTGGTTGDGGTFNSGASGGRGLTVQANAAGNAGMKISSTGGGNTGANSPGLTLAGFGTGAGLSSTGGATGLGISASSMTVTGNFTVGGNWLTTGTTTWTGAAAFSAGLTSNITGTLSTVTDLTNLPAITANWLTAAGIAAGALNGKGDWLLSSSYTAPDNADIALIKTQTDKLATGAALVTLADGVAHGGTPGSSTATFSFSKMVGVAQTANTTALTLTGSGSGSGSIITAGATGTGLKIVGIGTGQNALRLTSAATDGVGLGIDCIGPTGVAVRLQGTLYDLSAFGSINVQGATTLGSLVVAGTTTLTGAVSLGSTLGVTGATTLAALNTGTITTTGNLSISGTTTLTGAVTASSDSNSINLGASGLAKFFTLDTTKVFANAVSGSVVKETALGSATPLAAIADAIWDEARAGHVAAGSFGEYTLARLANNVDHGGLTANLALSNCTMDIFDASSFSLGDVLVQGDITVDGTTTLTGAIAATNALNDIRGVKLAADGVDLIMPIPSGANAMNLRQAVAMMAGEMMGTTSGAGTLSETVYGLAAGTPVQRVGTLAAGLNGEFDRVAAALTIPT